MLVREVMTGDVNWISPQTTIEDAARTMRDRDIGILPVGENDKLVGVVTDRDIVVRCLAEGKPPASTDVRGAMSDKVLYCFEDMDAGEAAANMAQNRIRRLPVVNGDKRLVGIVSLGDLAAQESSQTGGKALAAISR